jgi:hypothetical protein
MEKATWLAKQSRMTRALALASRGTVGALLVLEGCPLRVFDALLGDQVEGIGVEPQGEEALGAVLEAEAVLIVDGGGHGLLRGDIGGGDAAVDDEGRTGDIGGVVRS